MSAKYCGWCKDVIDEQGDPESHGICPKCAVDSARLSRHEVVEALAYGGIFPAKYGFRAVIQRVQEFERWQAGRRAKS